MADIRVARTRADDTIHINTGPTDWMEQAACVGKDPCAEDADAARYFANRYCRHCPVLDECLAFALKHKFTSIVAGGTFFNVHGQPNQRWAAQPQDPRCA